MLHPVQEEMNRGFHLEDLLHQGNWVDSKEGEEEDLDRYLHARAQVGE